MRLNQLSKLFDLNETVYFEGKLYERLYYDVKSRSKDGPKHKYRVVINSDDYDYVVEPALRKRLDRVFNKTDLEGRQESGSFGGSMRYAGIRMCSSQVGMLANKIIVGESFMIKRNINT